MCRLYKVVCLSCFVNSWTLSTLLVTSVSITLLRVYGLFSKCPSCFQSIQNCVNSGLPTHYHPSTDSFSFIDISFFSSVILGLPGLFSLLSFFLFFLFFYITTWFFLLEVHPSSQWNFDCGDWAGFFTSPSFILCIFRYHSNLLIVSLMLRIIQIILYCMFYSWVSSTFHGQVTSVLSLSQKSAPPFIGSNQYLWHTILR